MIEKDGKIVEATHQELIDKWLDEDWCEIMSFPEYLEKVKKLGTKVIEHEKTTM